MKPQVNHNELDRAKTADEFLAEYRSNPENERLFRESEIRFDVSERMKQMRKAGGLTQEELAQRVGCSQSFIAKLEGGAYDRCGLSTLRTYARAIGHDIDVRVMFFSLPEALYTGHSACADTQNATNLRDMLSGRLATLSIKSWEKSDELKRGTVELKRLSERKEIGVAA